MRVKIFVADDFCLIKTQHLYQGVEALTYGATLE
jgi:hypothetical protein